MNLKNKELDDTEYSQGSRNKNAAIIGFVWSQADEILIVTDKGVELFQVIIFILCAFCLHKYSNRLVTSYFWYKYVSQLPM